MAGKRWWMKWNPDSVRLGEESTEPDFLRITFQDLTHQDPSGFSELPPFEDGIREPDGWDWLRPPCLYATPPSRAL